MVRCMIGLDVAQECMEKDESEGNFKIKKRDTWSAVKYDGVGVVVPIGLQVCVSLASISECFGLPEPVDRVPKFSLEAFDQFFGFQRDVASRK